MGNRWRVLAALGMGIMASSSTAITSDPLFSDSFETVGASDMVPTSGGTITVENLASVHFPPDAFPEPTQVTVEKSHSVEISERLAETSQILNPSVDVGYQVIVEVDGLPPTNETYDATIVLPESFMAVIPDGHDPEVLVETLSGGDDELLQIFVMIPSDYDPATNTLIAQIPNSSFQEIGDTYQSILTLVATPGSVRTFDPVTQMMLAPVPDLTAKGGVSECKGINIICPLTIGCEVTSPFSPSRIHPVTMRPTPHNGVDYRATIGEDVIAAADSVVEASYSSSTYGQTIILRHNNGSATLYAHLSERLVSPGDPAARRQIIGKSGDTGIATGPHLHFEYVQEGKIIRSKNRIDPNACIGDDNIPMIRLKTPLIHLFIDESFVGSADDNQDLSVNNLFRGKSYSMRLFNSHTRRLRFLFILGVDVEFAEGGGFIGREFIDPGESFVYDIIVCEKGLFCSITY